MLEHGSVDLQPFADVTNNIIDKVADAIGFLAIPRGARKDRETAVETYIDEIQKDASLSPVVKAAKISKARREIKEYINMQDILLHAQEFAQNYESNDEPIDEEWAMYFHDKAKNVTREDAKILWGKILAEESIHPGCIPKQLVQTMSVMNKNDAELFERLCQFSVDRYNNEKQTSRMLLVDFNDQTGLVEKQEMNAAQLYNLESLGLINIVPTGVGMQGKDGEILAVKYHDKLIKVQVDTGRISTGNVVFTKTGAVLSELIKTNELEGFLDYVESKYKREGFTVTIDEEEIN